MSEPLRRIDMRGERHPRAKLTDADVAQLRLDRQVMSLSECAKKWGLSLTHTSRLTKGRSRAQSQTGQTA